MRPSERIAARKNASPKASLLARSIATESFVEKLVLLAATILLSGLIVPLAIKYIDISREGRESIRRAQLQLFQDLSETILTTETLVLDVSWFGMAETSNRKMQDRAFERYSERAVDLISKWRAQASRAQTLASPAVAKKINDFLGRYFAEQDTPLNHMWAHCREGVKPTYTVTDPIGCNWSWRHERDEALLIDANKVIFDLAKDMGLVNHSP